MGSCVTRRDENVFVPKTDDTARRRIPGGRGLIALPSRLPTQSGAPIRAATLR
jgi:hypothetical protein